MGDFYPRNPKSIRKFHGYFHGGDPLPANSKKKKKTKNHGISKLVVLEIPEPCYTDPNPFNRRVPADS